MEVGGWLWDFSNDGVNLFQETVLAYILCIKGVFKLEIFLEDSSKIYNLVLVLDIGSFKGMKA